MICPSRARELKCVRIRLKNSKRSLRVRRFEFLARFRSKWRGRRMGASVNWVARVDVAFADGGIERAYSCGQTVGTGGDGMGARPLPLDTGEKSASTLRSCLLSVIVPVPSESRCKWHVGSLEGSWSHFRPRVCYGIEPWAYRSRQVLRKPKGTDTDSCGEKGKTHRIVPP